MLGGRQRRDTALGFDARNHDAVVKWPKFHINPPKYLLLLIFRTERQGCLTIAR
jgi:hypothetical protein